MYVCCVLIHQGHFRRATVLEKLGRWLEAIAAYLLCLYLGGNHQPLVSTIACQVSKHIVWLLLIVIECAVYLFVVVPILMRTRTCV